jgi:hypothetical protein
MTRSRDVADTQDNLGGAVAPVVSGKNILINGAMEIAQRGTSFALNNNYAFTVDRWYCASFNSSTTITQDTASVPPNATNSLKFAITGATAVAYAWQAIEQANVIPLRGRTVTLSISYINSATLSGNHQFVVYKNTSSDAFQISNTITSLTVTASTTWNTASVTFVVPSDAIGLTMGIGPVSGQAVGVTYAYSKAQLEIGTVATPFARAGGSIGGELALCQRYYQKSYAQGTAPGTNTLSGQQWSVGGNASNDWMVGTIVFPTVMRTSPTMVIYSKNGTTGVVSDAGGTDKAANSGVAAYTTDRSVNVYNASGGTITAAFGGFSFHYTANGEL